MAQRRKDDPDPRIAFMMRALETPAVAYKLAGLLAWKYGSKGGAIFPSQETLAKDLGVMERTARDVIKKILVPIGLKVDIRRGPRTGTKMSYYSFDGQIGIPETRNPNTSGNSGNQTPKSAHNSGNQTQQFRCLDDNNSGTQTPPNQKIDPTESTKREGAPKARRPLSRPSYDDSRNSGAKNQPVDLQLPSHADVDFGLGKGLSIDAINREAEKYRERQPDMTFRLWLMRAIEYERRHPNVRPEGVGLTGFMGGLEGALSAKKVPP
jgi:hypothetical protein